MLKIYSTHSISLNAAQSSLLHLYKRVHQHSPCSDSLTCRPLGELVVKSPHKVYSETKFHPVTRYKENFDTGQEGLMLCVTVIKGRGELAPCWTVCVPDTCKSPSPTVFHWEMSCLCLSYGSYRTCNAATV